MAEKSGEFINQAEKVISQMIFVAEIMNTLPLSLSLFLGGEGDRLRLKKRKNGKGFVPDPPPLPTPTLSSLGTLKMI